MKVVFPCSLLFSSPLNFFLPSIINLLPSTTPIPIVHTIFNWTDICLMLIKCIRQKHLVQESSLVLWIRIHTKIIIMDMEYSGHEFPEHRILLFNKCRILGIRDTNML